MSEREGLGCISMEEAKLSKLRQFVDECRSKPSVLHDPSLTFFKDYLLSLGGRIPLEKNSKHSMHMESDDIDDEIIESDIEFQNEVVEEDNDPPQQMGDPSVEITEDCIEAAALCKRKAMMALSEGQLEEALDQSSESIILNPRSAIFYATRAIVFLKMNKPNAAIRDAEAALQINPDLAKGYKSRGMARALLGKWEEAACDLRLASKLDHDEEINSLLKEKVEPNVKKIEEHRRKYDRLRKEQETKKVAREKKRKEAQDAKVHDPESLNSLRDGTVMTPQSAKELETKLKAASTLNRLVILYFTATWCGPCRFMSPVYTKLSEKYPEVVFLKIDIDQLSAVAQSWNINSVPTFFFVKESKEVDKFVGADKGALERMIESYVSKR